MHTYQGVAAYMQRMIDAAKDTGYATTLFGRRRYLPELAASNHMLRAFGERVARNMPIQGTAADIIKIAMVRVDRRLYAEGMESRLILQVHDELIVEAAGGRGPPGTANCNGGDGARLQYGGAAAGRRQDRPNLV